MEEEEKHLQNVPEINLHSRQLGHSNEDFFVRIAKYKDSSERKKKELIEQEQKKEKKRIKKHVKISIVHKDVDKQRIWDGNSQDVINRLYKQDIIKRKQNQEILEDIYTPQFVPITNAYLASISNKNKKLLAIG